jgi:hypothetical protein
MRTNRRPRQLAALGACIALLGALPAAAQASGSHAMKHHTKKHHHAMRHHHAMKKG